MAIGMSWAVYPEVWENSNGSRPTSKCWVSYSCVPYRTAWKSLLESKQKAVPNKNINEYAIIQKVPPLWEFLLYYLSIHGRSGVLLFRIAGYCLIGRNCGNKRKLCINILSVNLHILPVCPFLQLLPLFDVKHLEFAKSFWESLVSSHPYLT